MTGILTPLPTITNVHIVATKGRLGGSRVAGIVKAWHALDARCVTCLTVTTYVGDAGDRPTFGHIVPASHITPGEQGGKRGGYTPDNGVLQCVDCQFSFGDTVLSRLHYLPTYVGASFPTTPRVARVESDHKQAMRDALTA